MDTVKPGTHDTPGEAPAVIIPPIGKIVRFGETKGFKKLKKRRKKYNASELRGRFLGPARDIFMGGDTSFLESSRDFEHALVQCGATFEDFIENVGVLRQYDTLPNEQWQTIDETIIREGARLLSLVAALPGVPVDDPLGTTELRTVKVDDITDPTSDMFGEGSGGVQSPDFLFDYTALPWHYIDLKFPASNVAAWRGLEPLAVEGAIRRLNIYMESLAFSGLPGTFGGRDFNGVTNAPHVNTTPLTNKWNASATTGDQMLSALITMLSALTTEGFFGPYVVLVPPATYRNMDRNFNTAANVVTSIRERLGQVDISIRQSHGVPTATGVLVIDISGDAARWASPVDPAAVTWTSPAGLTRYVKVISKAAPLVRDTYSGNAGIIYGT